MKALHIWAKQSKTWLKTLTICIEEGFLPKIVKRMAERKIDGDSESPPSKKFCTEEKIVEVEPEKKIRSRKAALLLAYLGDEYFGMQVNSPFKTIESELLSALIKTEYVFPEAFNNPQLIKFQRTARTDKGVSAAKQVVSLKLAESFSCENLNKHLPEDIKVFSAKKVTKGFNCKNDCTARTYSYTLPTFALSPELYNEYPENYRINEEIMQKTNEILQLYVGTVNFHNFTIKKDYNDPSVKRYITYFKTQKPFLQGKEEFITLTVKGQSFMFHQIRKMVGHTIAVLKGLVPENIQVGVFKNQKFAVPLAPGLGLMLEDVHFDRYDRRYGNDGIHETLNWNEIADEINNFRTHILSNITRKETERKSMYNWLLTLYEHSYDYDETLEHYRNKEEINETKILDKERVSFIS